MIPPPDLNPTDLSERIAAYADGQLGAEQARDAEAELASNPDARQLLAAHQDTTALLRTAFAEVQFIQPIPAWLAPRAPRMRAGARRGSAVAAGLMLAVLGYGAGAIWPGLLVPGFLVNERAQMLSEIAEYHAVYSRETVHLVEVPATQIDHLKAWLGRRVARNLVVPDLSSSGLTFAGGRLVVLDGAPVAELMYTRAAGLPIAFCVVHQTQKSASLAVERRGAMHVASWGDSSHTYVVVGEADAETIRGLAVTAQAQL